MGIIPRISEDIFEHIFAMDENLEFHIKVCVNFRHVCKQIQADRLTGIYMCWQQPVSDVTLSGIGPIVEK